jgi:lon-related putative ATP-dependent protease
MTLRAHWTQLRAACRPEDLGCDHTDDLTPLQGIIGQERAVRALRFGLGVGHRGFNIFVAGKPGTGKTTAVTEFLRETARNEEIPSDSVYVHNFKDPYEPRVISLPPGAGGRLAADMAALVKDVRHELVQAFESVPYAERRSQVLEQFGAQRRDILTKLTDEAKRRSMGIQMTPAGFLIVPLADDRPVSDRELAEMPEPEREAVYLRRREVETELETTLRSMRALEKQAAEAVAALDREVAMFSIGHRVEELIQRYAGMPEVVQHLAAVREDIMQNLNLFREQSQETPEQVRDASGRDVRFRRYLINVIVDNSKTVGAPVVMELNPTYNNLFGRIEKEAQFGAVTTDFTMIRSGSLHRANGGYLIVNATELLTNLFSYDSLKRALRSGRIDIEEAAERLGLTMAKSLRPEPVPLQVKVALIGDPLVHYLLSLHDPDFRELFKVKAEFDSKMERTPDNVRQYASFVCTLCEKERLLHLDGTAVAALVEHSSRLAGDQEKLSTKFSDIADLVREATHYAASGGLRYATAAHVLRAIDERHYRSNLIEEHLRELIAQGTVLIDTSGAVAGQVNGLAVSSVGDITFGNPARITATVSLGRSGLLDIERESRLGGPIHTKGVLILGGFLSARYAPEAPLSLSARLVFEQSYGLIDGDSASAAELCALLSALAGIPLRQSVAITGSVNQKGEVQAIGGVNEKVEGFYEVCRLRGLTGDQGVIIPSGNLRNLMLRQEVVSAVRDGLFNVYAVATVDDAIEILTGTAAGEPGGDGLYPEGTLNHIVMRRLTAMADTLRAYGPAAESPLQEAPAQEVTPPCCPLEP